jgi:predicted MPP superfamily phosphohydrolase
MMRFRPDQTRAAWSPKAPLRPARGWVGVWGLPRLQTYRLALPRWSGPPLRIAVFTDLHVCRPWVAPGVISAMVDQVNGLGADLIVLAGDVLPDRNLLCQHLTADRIVPLLTGLRAPLGVVAVMGNHDRRDCRRAMRSNGHDSSVVEAYAAAGMDLVLNGSRRVDHHGHPLWVVGFDSQLPLRYGQRRFHDPDAAFAEVPEGAPSILVAHEPDYFARGDTRPMLQLSGHTHGGQFVLFGRRPMTPSRFGDRYAVGHIVEGDRHMIVSAGIGYSGLPFRFGVPPEITLIEIIAGASAA